MDEYKNLEDQICEEIRLNGHRHALEKPNKNYNNLTFLSFC
jgi:hypothetical protein